MEGKVEMWRKALVFMSFKISHVTNIAALVAEVL
jgi:hypothetical protein